MQPKSTHRTNNPQTHASLDEKLSEYLNKEALARAEAKWKELDHIEKLKVKRAKAKAREDRSRARRCKATKAKPEYAKNTNKICGVSPRPKPSKLHGI